MGRHETVVEVYSRLRTLPKEKIPDPINYHVAMIALARGYVQTGDVTKALEILRPYEESVFAEVDFYNLTAGMTYKEAGNFQKARLHLQRVLDFQLPTDGPMEEYVRKYRQSQAYGLLAFMSYKENDFPQHFEYAEKMLATSPDATEEDKKFFQRLKNSAEQHGYRKNFALLIEPEEYEAVRTGVKTWVQVLHNKEFLYCSGIGRGEGGV